jgi:hypothetical protein
MALTSDGRLLAGATHAIGEQVHAEKVLARALKTGRRVFIGIELSKSECKAAMKRLDDAVAKIVALVDYRERG